MTGFDVFALTLVVLASWATLVVQGWRWLMFSFGMLYIGMFMLLFAIWPLELAVIKLVAGWMAIAILGATFASGEDLGADEAQTGGRVLRLLLGAFVLLLAWSLSSDMSNWVPDISASYAFAGLALVGMGLTRLGLTAAPMQVIFGMLLAFAGFEVIYAVVERSVLIVGLLATLNLGLAMVGAYLMVASRTDTQGVLRE